MPVPRRMLAYVAAVLACASLAQAQSLPTTQPRVLQVVREVIKTGHAADHVKTEAGWPIAFANAKSPYYYLALSSITGRAEVWFVAPFDSNAAMGDFYKRQDDNPTLSAELDRLARADAEHLTDYSSLHLVARPDLSHGAYPDIGKQRLWEITIFRVRPGQEGAFGAAAKAYGAATDRSNSGNSWRVYEVTAGMPGPTYMVFSSVAAFGEFDKMTTGDEATMKAFTPPEMEALQKFSREGLVNTETQRFRLDPQMSYVPADTRSQDPGFWTPKKPSN